MIFCKDCKHFKIEGVQARVAMCMRNAETSVDMVDGKTIVMGKNFAGHERLATDRHGCGPEAKFFSPKSAIERVLSFFLGSEA